LDRKIDQNYLEEFAMWNREGWRLIGPIICEMKQDYKESRRSSCRGLKFKVQYTREVRK
jgi:hypothetical protein